MDKTPMTVAAGSVPNPDPTILTTQMLQREIATSREITEGQIASLKRIVDRMEENIHTRGPEIVLHVTHLRDLLNERFASIATQFIERDTRTEQTSRDSKVAVDAALQAAKEAVGEQNKSSALAIAKSEASTTKQIDQIQALIMAGSKATDDKINDLKERIDRDTGEKSGAVQNIEGNRASARLIVSISIGVFGLVSLIIAVITFFVNHVPVK